MLQKLHGRINLRAPRAIPQSCHEVVFPMRLISSLQAWIDTRLREFRFARAAHPSHPAPPWIRAAESFSLFDANPMSSIPAGKIGWIEPAADASRLLARHALELQQAADSLELSRGALASSEIHLPHESARSDSALFGAIERQRRALSSEREALCLFAAALRERYRWPPSLRSPSPSAPIDKPQNLLGGLTLLAYFVSTRRLDAVEKLIEAGARPEAPCLDGSDALTIASRKAEAYAGAPASSAAIQASCILSLLESAALSEQALGAFPPPSRPSGRI